MKKSSAKIIIVLILLALAVFFGYIYKKETQKVETPKEEITSYDTTLSTKYISTQDTWPPVVSIVDKVFSCKASGNEVLQNGQTIAKYINEKTYCTTVTSEGAAGSIYGTYIYRTSYENQTAETTFTLRFTQCENYDDPEKTACLIERKEFNPDTLGTHLLLNYLNQLK